MPEYAIYRVGCLFFICLFAWWWWVYVCVGVWTPASKAALLCYTEKLLLFISNSSITFERI